MSLFVSDDSGASFHNLMQVDAGHTGYSALAVVNSTAVALAWEVPGGGSPFKGTIRSTTIDLGAQ
jgi:hypothetical protein